MLHRLSERFDTLPSLNQSVIDRHRTIQATIEWSYALLSEEEKALFMQLSVFTGGFGLSAAEEICHNESLPKEHIMDLLAQLVDRSMIQTVYLPGQPMRYKLLETLQRFASNLLVQQGQVSESRKRHLDYFTNMARQAYENQFESFSLWSNTLKLEKDNIHSALNWAEQNNPEGFRSLAGYLPWYWVLVTGSFVSGREYLERALSAGTDETETHARLLCGLGYLDYYYTDREKVVELLNESLSLWQQIKNPFEEAVVLGHLSASYQAILRDTEKAVFCSKRSLEIARKLDHPALVVNALQYLCRSLVHSMQFKKALPFVEELLVSSERINQSFGILAAYHFKGDCALAQKEFVDAEKKYGLASETAQKLGIIFQVYADIQGVAFALSGQSRWAKALRINAAALEGFKSIGVEIYGLFPMWDHFIDTYINGAKKAVGEKLLVQYEEEGRGMDLEKALEYALDFDTD
jgi:non-specific serine/threonine protein kinase